MLWIKSCTVLVRHRKLLTLADKLKIKPVHALGYLHALWHTVLEQAENGDLSKWSDGMIALAAQWEGDIGLFVKSLQEAEWLTPNKFIHDWLEYAGPYLERKYHVSNPERLVEIWAKYDRILKPKKNGIVKPEKPIVVKKKESLKNPPEQFLKAVPKKEKELPPFPEKLLAIPGFVETWNSWLDFRKNELKKKVGPRAAKEQFDFLLTQPDPIACIKQSIAQSYQGIFELKKGFGKLVISPPLQTQVEELWTCPDCLMRTPLRYKKQHPPICPAKYRLKPN